MGLELVLGGEHWLHGLNICLIPGKLFWYRSPEESGPALLAAVSIPGPLRQGRGGPPHPAQLSPGCWRVPLWTRTVEHRPSLLFPRRYYAIYDSGNRQRLLDAYHDGACCSLSIPFTPQNPSRYASQPRACSGPGFLSRYRPAPVSVHTAVTTMSFSSLFPRSNLGEYFKDSRNVKKLKDPSKRVT